MKLKASTLYIALLLCASLLLSLSWASAQTRNSKSNTRKSASAKTRKSRSAKRRSRFARHRNPPGTPIRIAIPLPTPKPTPTLNGSYILIDPAGATEKVKRAIDASANSVIYGFRGKAKSELTRTNLPLPQKITISYTATMVSIRTDVAGTIETSLDGTPVPWTKYRVSSKWVNGNLERTFESSEGQRVNTYSLSRDGQTLTMKVLATRNKFPKLNRPLEYQLEYQRN